MFVDATHTLALLSHGARSLRLSLNVSSSRIVLRLRHTVSQLLRLYLLSAVSGISGYHSAGAVGEADTKGAAG